MDYVKLQPLEFARSVVELSDEKKTFKGYKNFLDQKVDSSITSMEFSPVKPSVCVMTHGTRVELHNLTTQKCLLTLSSCKDFAQCASFRNDGKLLAVSDATGLVQIVNLDSRKIMRRLRGHTESVSVVRFASASSVVSAGKDKMVKVWDIASGTCVSTTTAHEDYIQALRCSSANEDTIISGGYDGLVKVWDSRIAGDEAGMKCVMQFNQDAPVEDLVIMPSGHMCIAAGGTSCTAWDLRAGKAMVTSADKTTFANTHTKVITSLSLDSTASRLFTSSLDQTVKVHSLETYETEYSYSVQAPVLSAAWNITDTMFVAGCNNGQWFAKKNKVLIKANTPAKPKKAPRYIVGQPKYFNRGKDEAAPEDATFVGRDQPKINSLDKLFRRFEYKQILDVIMNPLKKWSARFAFAAVQELIKQGGLEGACLERSDEECQVILNWISKSIGTRPEYFTILAELMYTVLKNKCFQAPSDGLVLALGRVNHRVQREIVAGIQLTQVKGILDIIMAA